MLQNMHCNGMHTVIIESYTISPTMLNMLSLRYTILYGLMVCSCIAFEIPNPFKAIQKASPINPIESVSSIKSQLLEAVSFTNNGKDASMEKQRSVLNLVRSLETEAPTPDALLTDAAKAQQLDGVW